MDPLVPVVHVMGPRLEPSEGASWASVTPTLCKATSPVFAMAKV